MEYVYIGRNDDEKIISEYKNWFELKTSEELIKIYNRSVEIGIVGARQQALRLIALRQEFLERFNESPVYLLKYVLGLVGVIELVKGHIRIKEQNGT